MTRLLKRALFLLAILTIFVAHGIGQVVGISGVLNSTNANEVDGYSATEIWDADTAYYYDAYVIGSLYQDQNDMNDAAGYSPCQYGNGYSCSEALTHSSVHQGSVYTTVSQHYLITYYQYTDGTYYNPDQYLGGNSFYGEGGGDPTGSGFEPGGGYTYTQEADIYLGYTYFQISTAPPSITKISPSSDIQGATGTIQVQGHNLRDDLGVLSASFRDSDITINGTVTGDSSTASVPYSVFSTASTGAHQLTLSNTWGESEPSTFTVNYPSATITGLSPSTWTAGQSYRGVQISGTNFGSAPVVTLSDPAISVSLPYNTSNASGSSSTYVDLSVPSTAPSEPVVVTLTAGPYTQVSGGPSLSASTTATVIGLQQNACPAMLDANSGFSAIAPTGNALGGSGSMTVSFTSGSFSGYGVSVPYGQFSTPESIAAHLAALITKQYSSSGLSAQASGAYILYKSTGTLGSISITGAGASFIGNPKPVACPPANLRYVLAVENDTVVWQPVPGSAGQRGRQVTYVIANWPTTGQATFNSLTFPSYTNADIMEHLTNGYTSSNYTADGVYRHAGQFADVLGTGSFTNGGTGVAIADRWFTVTLDGTPIPGSIMTFDGAGKHQMDHIEIHLPTGPSFLNYFKKPDGTPKDISLP